jgi:protease PrsW
MTVQPAPQPTGPLSAPRWGHQASIVQLRQPAFWLFAILLAVTTLLVLAEQVQILQLLPVSWLFSWLLLALYAVPVILAIYVLDLFEREPIPIMIAAFLWGAVVSIGLAAPTNTAWFEILFKVFGADFAQNWGPALIGPTIEETIKFLGLVLIYLIARSEIDDLFDGFIYGAMVGLGFAVVENVQYFVGPVAQSGGVDQIGPVIQMYVLRVVFSGLYMHVLWTGLTGIGLAYYVTRRDLPQQRRLLVAAGFFLAGVLAHFIWNSPFLTSLLQGPGGPGPLQMLLFGAFKGLPFFIFLAVMIVLAQRREQRWFSVASASETGTDVLSSEDVTMLSDLRRRWRARRLLSTSHGPAAGKALGRLQREQINLVMIRTRVDSPDHPDLVRQRELIRGLKQQLAALPRLPVGAARMPGGTATPPADATAAAAPAASTAVAPSAEAARPAVATGPPPPPPPPPAMAWAPTHRVPDGGLPAWGFPDPSLPPVAMLPAWLDLRSIEQAGDWTRVAASNGWTGWVDGRRLITLGS